MMGAARSASLRDVAPLNAGTARFFWRGALVRHSRLALPGLSGRSHSALALPMFLDVEEALATRDWHCQRLLAREGLSPLNAGTAKDYWRGAPTRHSGLALPGNGALAPLCAACKVTHKRYEPNRKEHPMFTELCIAFYTVMTLGIASAFLFTHAQQAK